MQVQRSRLVATSGYVQAVMSGAYKENPTNFRRLRIPSGLEVLPATLLHFDSFLRDGSIIQDLQALIRLRALSVYLGADSLIVGFLCDDFY